MRDAALDEVLLGLVDRAERILQRLFEFARNLVARVRLHPFPEMDVVIVLAGVVEHGGVLAERALDDLLEWLAFPLGSLERVIAVVDIGQVVLVVMKFERLARHDRIQRVVRIRQFGQREGHGTAPWEVGGRNRTPALMWPRGATFSPRTPAPQLHDNPSLRGLSYLLTAVYELMFRGGDLVASFE